MVLVRDIMSRDVLKISASASVARLTSILTRHRITGLPVLDSKGKLVGVVSEFDVIDRRGKTGGGIMSREPITLVAAAPRREAGRLVVTHRIRRVPVMDGDKLIGIVSRADIVHFFATRQWQCSECGFTDRGFEPPEICPSCGSPADKFHARQD